MDTFEGATPAERQGSVAVGVCWECGREVLCQEYVVCCTGTIFHICPDCEARVNQVAGEDSGTTPAASLPSETPP